MNFDESEIGKLLDLAKRSALEAETILLKYFGQLETVEEKDQAGLVTQADIEAEEVIIKVLKKATPDFDIIAEEQTYREKKDLAFNAPGRNPCWMIDPLDGTTNFVHGFSIFCTSIGLYFENKCYLGVVHAPILGQTFTAGKGLGAHLNGKKIKVSSRTELNQGLLATGFITSQSDHLEAQLNRFTRVMRKVRGVRRAGSAAYDLAMVAQGTFDSFWEEHLNPWDTCAGVALVEEAGGIVTGYGGKAYTPFQKNILASSQNMHHKMLSILKETDPV